MTTTKKTPTLAHRVPTEVTPVILAYAAWLEQQTGYKVDPMSVYLGSQLRSNFQKSEGNQKRIADRAAEIERERAARAASKAEREKAAKAKPTPAASKATPAPKRRRPAATVATDAGVVIAEQRHVDGTKEA